MAYAKDFTYDGQSLSTVDPNLYVLSFGSSGSVDESQIISRTVNRSPLTYDDSLTYDYGAVDSDIYRLTITLARLDGERLTQAQMRTLEGWLVSPTEPRWLRLERCEDIPLAMYDNINFKGRFVRVNYEESPGYRKNGVTFMFENISPYGFTDVYEWRPTDTAAGVTSTRDFTGGGTNLGKLIPPIIILKSLSDATSEVIDMEQGSDDVQDQTSEAAGIELEEGTPQDAQTIKIRNLDANTGAFTIRIPKNTTVAIIDDNTYYYLGDIDSEFDPEQVGELYPFDNVVNFNWPRLITGVNHFRIYGGVAMRVVARFYEALGV